MDKDIEVEDNQSEDFEESENHCCEFCTMSFEKLSIEEIDTHYLFCSEK